jgi:hypothetical protein
MHSSTWRRVEPSLLPLLFDATEALPKLLANVVTFVDWSAGDDQKFPDHFYFRMRLRRAFISDRTVARVQSRTRELIDFDSPTLLP